MRSFPFRVGLGVLSAGIFGFPQAGARAAGDDVATRASLVRQGAVVQKFATIQEAVDAAQGGDLVRIEPGTHHEALRIARDPRQGGEGVVIDGGGAVLDGADPGLQAAPNTRWTEISEGVYQAEVPWSGDSGRAHVTWASRESGPILAAYHKKELWEAMTRGPGTLREGTTVRLRPGALGNPNLISLNIGVSAGVVTFQDAAGWTLQNVELRHGGMANVVIDGPCRDIVLDRITSRDAFRGITTGKESADIRGITITNCMITNRWNADWPWRQGYADGEKASDDLNGPMRGAGIYFYGADSEIARNTIRDGWDGMGVRGRNLDVHGNTISGCLDDGVELESGRSSNIRFHDNLLFDVFAGISVVSNQPGPIYIYRNRVSANRLVVFDPDKGRDRRFGYGIKMGNDWGIGAQKVYFYHNTFYDKRQNLWDKEKAVVKDFQFLNNIFVSEGRSDLSSENTVRFSIWNTGLAERGAFWNGNLYFRPGGQGAIFRKWNGHEDVATLEEAQKLFPAWEASGQQADPRFADLNTEPSAANTFALAADSPARDKAAPLPEGWPDSGICPDGKPDVGALEYSEAAP
jgi:hypothetical protein